MQFVDIEGILKHVTVTAEQLDDVVEGKIMFDGSSIKGFSPINRSDLYLLPDLNTFAVLPWTVEEGYAEARFLCSVTNPDGTLFEGDPRNVLKKRSSGRRKKDIRSRSVRSWSFSCSKPMKTAIRRSSSMMAAVISNRLRKTWANAFALKFTAP
ncbi:Glutamine synthetase [Geobacillus sp. BCO2]|nr:Glutamine synthetase [Geobacillus sp. BCO2]